MSPRDKLEGVFKHGRMLRALWRHFPHEDFHTDEFVAAHCEFVRRYRMDLAKITPRSSYGLRDYGSMDVYAGDYLGRPKYVNRVVETAGQWEHLPILNPRHGYLQQMLEITRAIVAEVGREYAVLLTVFSPLTQAGNLAGLDRLAEQWKEDPSSVHRGLKTLAQSTLGFLEALKTTGVDGIYFVVQEGNWPGVAESGLLEAVHPLNQAILGASPGWLNAVHVHGQAQGFTEFARYAAQILHWDHQASGVSTQEGARLFPGMVSASIAWPLSSEMGGGQRIRGQVRQMVRSGLGASTLLSSECVIPFETPPPWIEAFIEAADEEIARCEMDK